MTFFSFLGSFINFIDLLENSKGEICPPDPCDIKPNEIEGILATVTDLCRLLNPEQGLPPLPLGSMMDALGANDFIVDNTYESYKTIPNLNGSYQTYINDFFTDGQTVVEKLLKLSVDSETDFVAIGIDADIGVLGIFGKTKIAFGQTIIEKLDLKQQVFTDNKLKFGEFDKVIQKNWLSEVDGGKLNFSNDVLIISNYSAVSADENKQNLNDFMRRYLEASYPFAVLSLVSSLIPENTEFLNFYDGWNAEGQEFTDTEDTQFNPKNLAVKFNGYLKYTKPILKNQLKQIQKDTKVDVSTDEGKENLNENLKFALSKQDFGL